MASLYRATASALETASVTDSKANTFEHVLRDARNQMTLEKGLLSHQINFQNLVDTMKREEQAEVVFTAFCPRNKNHMEAAELEIGLQHLRATSKPDFPSGEELVAVFATTKNGNLRLDDFASVLDGLAALSRDCTFEEMCQLLLHHLVFSKTGCDFIAATVTSIAGQSRFKIDDAITEARLLLLYKAMSQGSTEMVPVKNVLKALFSFIHRIGEVERQSLLDLNCWNLRKIDYELFSEHIVDVVSCVPGSSVDDLIKEMTLAICRGEINDDDINDFVKGKGFDSSSSSGSWSIDSFDR